ncbi:hypothetical protein BH23ACT10_BH23ACT10_38160 [soil metagenome]
MRRSALVLGLLVGLAFAPVASQALRERAAGDPPQRVDEPAAAIVDASSERDGDTVSAIGDAEKLTTERDDAASDDGDVPEFTHRSARLEDVARTPVTVRIDAIGIDAPVIAVGTDDDRQLDVPPDGSTVVWYRSGSVPGAAGSAVLAAHVDYAGRPGAFYALDQLTDGDTVRVGFDDGSTLTFAVDERTQYEKAVLPVDELFTRSGDAVLTLITCGGQFNHTTRHYDSNTVVQATLP